MRIVDVVFIYQLASPALVQWHSRRHTHGPDDYELHYFLDGDGRFENGRERSVISRGMLSFSRPGELHAIQPGDFRRPISYYAVLFALPREDPLRKRLEEPRFTRTFPRSIGSRQRLLFEDVKTGYTHSSTARVHAAHHKLQAFLWELTAQGEDAAAAAASPGGEAPGSPPDSNVHITRAIRLFEEHLSDTVTVAEVAGALKISQPHLTRLFTYHYGVSPLQYYRRLRMDVAASMLLDTTQSIKEIAWELGYSNQFHFSRSFSRYAGMSPSRYRQQYYRNNPTRYATRVVSLRDRSTGLSAPADTPPRSDGGSRPSSP